MMLFDRPANQTNIFFQSQAYNMSPIALVDVASCSQCFNSCSFLSLKDEKPFTTPGITFLFKNDRQPLPHL